MKKKNNDTSNLLISIALFIIIPIMIGYVVYDFLSDKNSEKVDITKDEVSTLVKTYYIDENNSPTTDLYDDDNVEYWNITNVKYIGYYNGSKEIKYFKASGNFQCKDNSVDCIYMAQANVTNPESIIFELIFTIRFDEDGYSLSQIISPDFEDKLKEDSETKEGFVLVDDVIS